MKFSNAEKIGHMVSVFDNLGKEATKPLANSCGGCFVEGFMYNIRFDLRNDHDYDLLDEIRSTHPFTRHMEHTIEMMEEILDDEFGIMIDWDDHGQPLTQENKNEECATCGVCGGEIEELSHCSENLDEDGVPENGWCDCV